MRPGCPAAAGSFSQNVHLGTAVVFFGSISITPLLVGIGLSRNHSWKFYRSYSIASGLASTILFIGCSLFVPERWARAASIPSSAISLDGINGHSSSQRFELSPIGIPLSRDLTTFLFKISGSLFLGFIEIYAAAIFVPLSLAGLAHLAKARGIGEC